MLAVLVEDPSAAIAASLPFTRELRLPTHDWQPADPGRLALELEMAMEQVRRALSHECKAAGIACRLETTRGDPATAVVDLCGVHDIVAVSEPPTSTDLMTGVTDRMRRAALASVATVLLLPSRPGVAAGPVVAVVSGPDDPGLPVAVRLAARTARRLLVMSPDDTGRTHGAALRMARRASLPAGSFEIVPLAGQGTAALIHVLAHQPVYCMVTTRTATGLPDATVERLSSRLALPILLVEAPAVAA